MINLNEIAHKKVRRNSFLQTLSVSGTQYTSGYVIGGMFTIDSATATNGVSNSQRGPVGEADLSAILQSLSIYDPTGQGGAIDFFFFGKAPTATYTDNQAFAPSDADLQSFLGSVSVTTYIAAGTPKVATAVNCGLVVKPSCVAANALSSAIYCIPVVRATPTYTTLKLYLQFGFSQGL